MTQLGLQKSNTVGIKSQYTKVDIKKRPEILPFKRYSHNFLQKTRVDWLLEIFEPEFNYIDTTESEARRIVKSKNGEV